MFIELEKETFPYPEPATWEWNFSTALARHNLTYWRQVTSAGSKQRFKDGRSGTRSDSLVNLLSQSSWKILLQALSQW
jgi:hypothetical protein